MTRYNALWRDTYQSYISKGVGYRHRKRLALGLLREHAVKGRILDVGCGDGSAFSVLEPFSTSLTGMDVSDVAIDVARKAFPTANFLIGDITRTETLPDNVFDLITCFDMLEEISDDHRALANMNALLAPGGAVLVTTQHAERYRTRFDEHAGNVRRYELAALKEKLNAAGFELAGLRVWGFPFYNFYYKQVLSRANPEQAWKRNPGKMRFLLNALYLLLFADDLFMNDKRGRIIALLAKKIE